MRREFQLTGEDIRYLSQSIVGGPPSGTQARANAAWAVVGLKRGFDWTTVESCAGGYRFSAEEMTTCTAESVGGVRCPQPVVAYIGNEPWCRVHKEWIEEDAARALGAEAREETARAIEAQQGRERAGRLPS